MANKRIVILDGISQGKTKLIELVKDAGLWCWNVNFRNLLSKDAHELGWDGNRNKSYYEFLTKFEDLTNEYFNSQILYYEDLINKCLNSDRTHLLFVHNSRESDQDILMAKYQNCINVLITDNDEPNEKYTLTMNYKNERFEQDVLNLFEDIEKVQVKEG